MTNEEIDELFSQVCFPGLEPGRDLYLYLFTRGFKAGQKQLDEARELVNQRGDEIVQLRKQFDGMKEFLVDIRGIHMRMNDGKPLHGTPIDFIFEQANNLLTKLNT